MDAREAETRYREAELHVLQPIIRDSIALSQHPLSALAIFISSALAQGIHKHGAS